MFVLALLIGIYSYLIFGIGLLGILHKNLIILATFVYILTVLYFYKKKLKSNLLRYFKIFTKCNFLFTALLAILVLQVIINFIGALGPELGFDALWYHLTLPKIYLINHSISYIPGGLFYYSVMPKLIEMLYVGAIVLGSEITAKLVHFSFGILSLFALYNLSRKFLSKTFSLLVLVLFYSNLVVGWMSITAYVDLARTFFELMALWAFINWVERKGKKWLIESAAMLGLAISVKLLAIGSLLIFSLLIIYIFSWKKRNIKTAFIGLLGYWVIGLFIAMPWFVFAFVHTGNPIYPFFTNIYPVKFGINLINPLNLSDPISPLYVIFLPIALVLYKKFEPSLKLLSLYSFLAILIWYVTSPTGGGRFILPYLPVFSIISISIIKMIRIAGIRRIFVGTVIVLSLFSIIYRGAANFKYVPVILGKETKAQFLSNRLNFSFGDFYDTDGYFSKKIKQDDAVLLYGFHNLYYVNFPFIHSSYAKKGDTFNYVAVQGNNIPERFNFWDLVYYNKKTNVKLYSVGHSTLRDEPSGSDSKRGLKWVY